MYLCFERFLLSTHCTQVQQDHFLFGEDFWPCDSVLSGHTAYRVHRLFCASWRSQDLSMLGCSRNKHTFQHLEILFVLCIIFLQGYGEYNLINVSGLKDSFGKNLVKMHLCVSKKFVKVHLRVNYQDQKVMLITLENS